jgi:hypothetical protein
MVNGPVPRSYQGADADRLPDDQGRAISLFEFECLECADGRLDVLRAAAGLGTLREPPWSAHFVHYGFGDVVVALGKLRQYRLQQFYALLACRRCVAGRGMFCRSHGTIDVGRRSEADAAARRFGCRIDDVNRVRRDRIDPLAIDIEFQHLAHDCSSHKQPRIIT